MCPGRFDPCWIPGAIHQPEKHRHRSTPRTIGTSHPPDHDWESIIEPVTVTLGIVPRLPDWSIQLSQDVLPNMQPGETREVTLTVTPPAKLPLDGSPILDIEAFANGNLFGGFRKIFRPPVPIHIPEDPLYAKSRLALILTRSYLDNRQNSVLKYSIPPMKTILSLPPSALLPLGSVYRSIPVISSPILSGSMSRRMAPRGFVFWISPDWQGKFCVKVTLEMEGHDPVWSQRNIDVGEPLESGVPHELFFPVGSGDYTEPVTITMGLILHKEGWQASLSDYVLENVQPGQIVEVSLSVTPPISEQLGSGDPIVDVEAYINGVLRVASESWMSPIPIHKPHEKVYSEQRLSSNFIPPSKGKRRTLVQWCKIPVMLRQQWTWSLVGKFRYGDPLYYNRHGSLHTNHHA